MSLSQKPREASQIVKQGLFSHPLGKKANSYNFGNCNDCGNLV